MEPSSHYFSASPTADGVTDAVEKHRNISVTLAGRQLQLHGAPGVFSFTELDRGTRALLETVPDELPDQDGAQFLDIGSGWGPIAITMGLLAPRAHITAIEVNDRARALTAANASLAGLNNVEVLAPEQVPADRAFDQIWSNPPIRVGKQVLHEILTLWLPRLAVDGEAWLVVAKKLGADSLQPWIDQMLAENLPVPGASFSPVERVDTIKGFRILRVTRLS